MSLDRATLAILGVALVLRLAVGWTAPTPTSADAAHFRVLAESVAAGAGLTEEDGTPAVFRPPVYPTVLGGIYRVFGPSARAVGVVQALMDTVTLLLLWWLAASLLGRQPARYGLVLMALAYAPLAAVRLHLTETLATLLLAATVVALVRALRGSKGAAAWAGTGVLSGLLMLTRGAFVLWPVVLAGYGLLALGRRREWRRSALILAAAFVTVLPWLVRNQIRVGSPMLTSQVGITAYASYVREPGQPYGVLTRDSLVATTQALTPGERSSLLTRATMRWIVGHPLQVLREIPVKAIYFAAPFDWEIIGGRALNYWYILVAPLALLGWVGLVRRDRLSGLLLASPTAYLLVISLIFYGSPRLRLPSEYFLALLAGYALAQWRSTSVQSADPAAENGGDGEGGEDGKASSTNAANFGSEASSSS